jgi:HEAT repeat protein
MALHAWLCGDERPDWAKHLRSDAAGPFVRGLKYLQATEDSLLRPDNVNSYDKNPSIRKLLDQLVGRSASARVAALWELARCDNATAEAVEAVARCLDDAWPGLRAEAARTLAQWGVAAEAAIPRLADALYDGEEECRIAAAYALGMLHMQADSIVPQLADRLNDPPTIDAAAWALSRFGAEAAPAMPQMLAQLQDELERGVGAIDYLVYAIRHVSPNAEAEIRQVIASCDPETQPQAEEVMPEDGPPPNPPGRSGLRFWADGSA